MLFTPIGRLRLIGLIEATSFLVLLCVAMPLKYFAGIPEAVKLVGWIHGLLFIVYMVAIVLAVTEARLSIKMAVITFFAAIIPLGPFVIEGRLKREDEARSQPSADM